MKLPYLIVTYKNPFIGLNLTGIDLSKITSTGDTYLSVYRVNNSVLRCNNTPTDPDEAIHYTPIGYVAGNKFTFALDNNILSQEGGRFRGDLYYKNTYIDSFLFNYNKIPLSMAVSNGNV